MRHPLFTSSIPNTLKGLTTLIIAALILVTAGVITPEPAAAKSRIWMPGTAHTLPAKRLEVGLFQPLRYGLTDSVELSTFPLVNALMPNLRLQKCWGSLAGGSWATGHALKVPTLLLRTIAREGTGGVLPEETTVPWIFALDTELIWTRAFSEHLIITPKATVSLAGTIGDDEWFHTIDLALVYPRMSAWYNLFSATLSLDVEGRLWKNFHYLLDVDLFFLLEHGPVLEHKGMLTWRPGSRFALTFGYKFTAGDYPFGKEYRFLPMLDVIFGFN